VKQKTPLDAHGPRNESAKSAMKRVNGEMLVFIALHVAIASVSATTSVAGTALNTTLKASSEQRGIPIRLTHRVYVSSDLILLLGQHC
jgi:hypothetical protein